jgi:2-C-methyl-D-erythritol 4-phosphate cytidylyltransferase
MQLILEPMKQKQMHNKIWAIIPAAGSGSRFSKTELKQYQIIQDQTVLQHTVSRINQLNLEGYVLAIGEQDDFAQTLAFACQEKLHFCLGGQERVNSVLNALTYLSTIASEDDWVMVHDAARPCVDLASLENLVDTAITQNTHAILATPVRDTLKKAAAHSVIDKTVSREALWQAQTPQMSKIGILKKAIEHALSSNMNITDEASALEFMNEKVLLVQGRADNIKITYPEDLVLAKLILESQKN